MSSVSHRSRSRVLILGALWLTASCARSPEPQTETATRVASPELGIALASLPAPFELVTNQGGSLELRAPGPNGAGTAWFEVGPTEVGGVNLVAQAKGSRAWFETQPAGQYFGNLELVTPIGSAFTARGSYELDATTVEELHVFALHPTANRLLRVTYRYPPGEGQERMQQLAELLGEIEPLPPDDQEASSSGAAS